jgi:glycosyltransferase involved in cell wall biosynthesis
MNIGISSPVTINKFTEYLNEEFQGISLQITGLKAPAVDTLILGLLKAGHNVSVYTLAVEVKDIIILHGLHLTIFVAPIINHKWWRPFGIFTYKAMQIKKCVNMDSINLDVIHAHWTSEYAIGILYSGRRNIPIIVTVRDWMPAILKLNKFHYYFYVRYVLNFIVFKHENVKFIANSQYIAKLIKRKWGKDVPVVSNPISDMFFVPAKQEIRKKFRIISITNNICKGKNIDILIKAFRLFNSEYENIELYLVGRDFHENHPTIIKWKQNGFLENVKLFGHVNNYELVKVLDQSDLLVHPSLEESFGNILLEAMARKVAIIGGLKSGAVPDILLHGKVGYLCDVTSVNAIKDAIVFLYSNVSYRNELVSRAYDYLLNNYTQSHIVDITLEQYHKAIKQNDLRN